MCESMPGFNDQQRGRGCILATAERRKERGDGEGEGEGKGKKKKKKEARQANNAGRKKARGKELRRVISRRPPEGASHENHPWCPLLEDIKSLLITPSRASTVHGKAKKTKKQERSYRCKLSVLSRLFCISLFLPFSLSLIPLSLSVPRSCPYPSTHLKDIAIICYFSLLAVPLPS